MSSRTELYDDVVDVSSFLALDVELTLSSSFLSLSALDVVEINIILHDDVEEGVDVDEGDDK